MRSKILLIYRYSIWQHDLEGYFESLAPQGFQNNPFFRSDTKKREVAPANLPSCVTTYIAAVISVRTKKERVRSALSFLSVLTSLAIAISNDLEGYFES